MKDDEWKCGECLSHLSICKFQRDENWQGNDGKGETRASRRGKC